MTKQFKRLTKSCAICGKQMKVFIYPDKKMRGGHYFGKIPLYSKAEMARVSKGGTVKEKIGSMEFNVLKLEGKPYRHAEYWECPKCYWRK